mmetsp:Transcript_3970/g.12653  ORF Transcript_3970/g.12653 Transcript_3970/m.12653 type:complete len:86 (+) Transcript_3970:245-502(+)
MVRNRGRKTYEAVSQLVGRKRLAAQLVLQRKVRGAQGGKELPRERCADADEGWWEIISLGASPSPTPLPTAPSCMPSLSFCRTGD